MEVRKVIEIIQRIALVIAVFLHVGFEAAFMLPMNCGHIPSCDLVLVKDYCSGVDATFKYLEDPMAIMKYVCYLFFMILYYIGFVAADVLIISGVAAREEWLFVVPAIYHLYAFFHDFHMLFFSVNSIYPTIFFIQLSILLSMWNLCNFFDDEQRQDPARQNNRGIQTVRVPQPGGV